MHAALAWFGILRPRCLAVMEKFGTNHHLPVCIENEADHSNYNHTYIMYQGSIHIMYVSELFKTRLMLTYSPLSPYFDDVIHCRLPWAMMVNNGSLRWVTLLCLLHAIWVCVATILSMFSTISHPQHLDIAPVGNTPPAAPDNSKSAGNNEVKQIHHSCLCVQNWWKIWI
jgi:hypothetical protein